MTISSYSGKLGNCIDVSAPYPNHAVAEPIRIMETNNPAVAINTTKANFAAFIKGVKDGEFDQYVE